jgi:hypothetical protein
MEGLFRDGNQAAAEIATSLKTSLLGRTVKAVDHAAKSAADTTFKAVVGPSLERRGYRLLGLNVAPLHDMGLSRGQREVRFTSYAQEADPYLREARAIAETLLASQTQPATGLVLGKGEVLVRVVFPSPLDSIESSQEYVNKSKGAAFLGPCMACAGGKDLTVVDMRVSLHTMASVANIVDKIFGSNRSPPSYYLNQAIGAVTAKVAKSLTGEISAKHKHYVRFEDSRSEEQYMYSVKLLVLAMYFNRAQRGVHTAAHHALLDNSYITVQNDSSDSEGEYGEGVWFSRPSKSEALEKLEKSIDALIRRQGSAERVIPCLPATQFTGTPYEDMRVRISDQQHEELLKQHLNAEGGGTQFAFHCGPNVSGARPPLDVKHPLTWATAYTRHFCKVEKTLVLPDGDELPIYIDKADKQMPKLGKYETRAWDDMIQQHSKLMREWLENSPNAKLEGKPHSHTREEYDVIKGEVSQDEEWGARKLLRAMLRLKTGEGADRGRFVTLPGSSNRDARRHQCASSEIVQLIEAFHQEQFGFRNYKGTTVTGKARKTARMVAHCEEGFVCGGFDKASNDRTWNHRKWSKFEEYTMAMATVITDWYMWVHYGSLLEADADHALEIEWKGIYLTVSAEIQYWYLQSALNPTSLCNRLQADVGIGAGILQGWGEEHYLQWLHWCSGVDAQPMDLPEIDHEFPFVLEGVEAKEHHVNGFMHYSEGDDTCVKVPCGKRTNAEAIAHFARSVHVATNEIWEAAYVSAQHLNTHGGPRSCVEVMSMVVAQQTNEDGVCEFAYLPKPMKRLDKLAWTLSSTLKIAETTKGKVGVLDSTFHRLNATRCLSLCMDMQHCLWVRRIVYATAKFHVQELRKMAQHAGIDTPLYGDRTQEKRGMPDAPGLIGDSIEAALVKIGIVLDRTDITTLVCKEANANAWGLHTPALLADGKGLRDRLIQLDEVAKSISITWEHIENPATYLSLFDLGPLEAAFDNACDRLQKAVEFAEEHERLPLEAMREALLNSVKATKGGKQFGANAQSQQPAPTAKTGQGAGALDRGGKRSKAGSSRDSTQWTYSGGSRWNKQR